MLWGGVSETEDGDSCKQKKFSPAPSPACFYIIKEKGKKKDELSKGDGETGVEKGKRIYIFIRQQAAQTARRENGKADYDAGGGDGIVQKGYKAQ